MSRPTFLLSLIGKAALILVWVHPLHADVPLQINHQGVVKVNGTPFSGTGLFRFAILDPSNGLNGWTNDGSALFSQGTPETSLSLPVTDGLYSVRLGDLTIAGMQSLPEFLFAAPRRVLRVWFDDGTHGLMQLSPDHPLTSTPYSFHSAFSDAAMAAEIATMALQADFANDADMLDGLDSAELVSQISESLQRIVREFEVAPGESVEPGNVVSFVEQTSEIGRGFQVPGVGSEFVFGATAGFVIDVKPLTQSSFVVAFTQGDLAAAIVGEVVDASLEFGTFQVANASPFLFVSLSVLSPDKFAVVFAERNGSRFGKTRIGTVAGREIQFGSTEVFNNVETGRVAATSLTPSRLALAYTDTRPSATGFVRLADVSGTTVSLASETIFDASLFDLITLSKIDSNRFVLAQGPLFGVRPANVRIGTVSGTTVTLGPSSDFNAEGESFSFSVAPLAPDRIVVVYDNNSPMGAFGAARVGEVAGDAVIFGDKFEFADFGPGFLNASAISSTEFFFTYGEFINSIPLFPGKWRVGRIEGSEIEYGPERFFETRRSDGSSSLLLAPNRFVVAYRDAEDAIPCKAVLGRLDETAVIGIARENGMEGELVDTTLFANGSVSDTHTGLVVGTTYYGQPDGGVTTNNAGARLGVAVSATEILLDP